MTSRWFSNTVRTADRAAALGLAISVLSLAGVSVPALGQDWVSFEERSSAMISSDPTPPDGDPVGLVDPFEKDLAVGDVDRDGDLDLVIARKVRFSNPGGKKNVLFLNEEGVMVDRTATYVPDFADLTDDRDVILVDLDGDDWLDIVTATTFSDQPRVYMNLGQPAGTWLGFDWEPADNRIPAFAPAPKFCAVVAGDVTGDGRPDLFFVDYDNTLEDRLLINDGNGFFTDETATRLTVAQSDSAFGTDAQIVDMNGDGARDIVKLSTLSDSPNSARIIYNDPTNLGVFDCPQPLCEIQHIDAAEQPYMLEVADFNNDTRPDVFVVDDGQDNYYLNMGNDSDGQVIFSKLVVQSSPDTNGFGGNTATADLDDDGFLDIVVTDIDTDIQNCDDSSYQMAALRNGANPPNVAFTDPVNGASRPWLVDDVFDLAIFDIDGDGRLDFWAGTCSGNVVFVTDRLFVDGFESGDTGAWAATQP